MKIKLNEWGKLNYSPAPSVRILRSWVSSGQIYPSPEKVGREWMVDVEAVRVPIIFPRDTTTLSVRALHILKTT